MTYVREQTSEELDAHMRSLQKMAGWFDPLSDRLWQEVEMLKDKCEMFRKDAERFQFIAQDAESSLERIYGDDWLGVVDQLMGMGEKP